MLQPPCQVGNPYGVGLVVPGQGSSDGECQPSDTRPIVP